MYLDHMFGCVSSLSPESRRSLVLVSILEGGSGGTVEVNNMELRGVLELLLYSYGDWPYVKDQEWDRCGDSGSPESRVAGSGGEGGFVPLRFCGVGEDGVLSLGLVPPLSVPLAEPSCRDDRPSSMTDNTDRSLDSALRCEGTEWRRLRLWGGETERVGVEGGEEE
jgi:hypothetical protein